ncbi:MAG: 3-dehydrosphinganine reductase [Vezdaea aestivalis]|nr:MAG: 3-dehydrosphinganine reductase [Vezdaea aestivalis]
MDFFKRKNHFPVDGKTILITGGSSGMGLSVSRMLVERGANVIIVARNETKLDRAKSHIQTNAIPSKFQFIHTISADLSCADTCSDVLSRATSLNNNHPPDIVWCIAGSAHPSYFIDAPASTISEQMSGDYLTSAYIAHATLRRWLAPARPDEPAAPHPRHLIFTSSVVAFYPIAGYSLYAPAKAALRSLADTLRQEVLVYNGARQRKGARGGGSGPVADVKIHAVFPNTIYGAGLDAENLLKPEVTKVLEDGDPGQTADEVAVSSIKALEKGEYLITGLFLGSAMRASAFGGSPRNNVVRDTLMSWVTSLAWPVVGPDLDGKAWKWGNKHGNPSTFAEDGK